MDEIEFNYETNENVQHFSDLINDLLLATKKILKIEIPLTLSVTFIDETKSLAMNQKYRNKAYVADVISFPLDDEFNLYKQIGFREIGDIFLCFSEASRKAARMHHQIETEIAWLFTHGLLHVLGYDHEQDKKEANVMFALTDEILATKNLVYEME